MPKPVLVLIQYEEKAGLLPEGRRPIKSIVEIDPGLCSFPCDLDGEKDEWKIFTHLRANGTTGGHVQLALKLELPAPVQDYWITISATETGPEEAFQPCPDVSDGTQLYYVIPTTWYQSGKKLIPQPGASGNIASAGTQFIRVYLSGKLHRTIRLRVCPSSLSDEEYRLVLQDIALIHRQLLMGKTNAVSVGERRAEWGNIALDMEKQIAQMKDILRRLEAAPEQELTAVPSRLPRYKIKKFTPKTRMDQAAGKRLLRTDIHEESYDIYEHRMIRTYLEHLKKLAGQYREIEKQEWQALAGEPISETEREAVRKQLVNTTNGLFQSQIEGLDSPPFHRRDSGQKAKDELFYYTALNQKINFKKNIPLQGNGRWDSIEQKIDHLLASSPLLRGVGTGGQLHTSNLFAKHRNYRRAYHLMRDKLTQFAGIDLWEGNPLLVDKSEQLYELWCLLKMLSIWINDYSFTLRTPTMEALTGQLLQHLRDPNAVVETIVLVKADKAFAGMELRLDYDKQRSLPNGKSLRPDYFLTISHKGRKFQFCMDAKYRNYAPDQMTKAYWYQDMFEVALDKYICRLGAAEEISGSYILHSDSRSRGGSGPDVGRYFWSKAVMKLREADGFRQEWNEINGYLHKQAKNKNEQNLLNRLPRELEEARNCSFGAICFTPLVKSGRAPDTSFRCLMQMIMEHFLHQYREKCWICGSEELEVATQFTNSRYEKYHIVCKKCKEFWVESHCYSCHRKLGKHLHNYYRTKKGNTWYVICPDCSGGL